MRPTAGPLVPVLLLAFSSLAMTPPAEVSLLSAAARASTGLDQGDAIPHAIWTGTRCVIVVPEIDPDAFDGGAEARGVASCRLGGNWSAPMFVLVAKGSWAAQLGDRIDLVLLVQDRRARRDLIAGRVVLDANTTTAGGPTGRDNPAETAAQATAGVLAYQQSGTSRGAIDPRGGVILNDRRADEEVYGRKATPRRILTTPTVKVPSGAEPFLSALIAEDAACSPHR